MKTNLKGTLMLTAAVLTLSAAAAYGQERVTANIPFAFRTNAGVQAPGPYAITRAWTRGIMTLSNLETRKATILGFGIQADDAKNAPARLVFRCGDESGCVLSSYWDGSGSGVTYRAPHLKPSELEHTAVLYFDRKPSE